MQIYCDFSGYSDIAIGTAKLFGIRLMQNFAYPYFSVNLKEFWRRWHISLSLWFRDYVYIPLGGNRHGPLRQTGAILITFLLCGIWHGASWNFMAWGLIHGLAMLPGVWSTGYSVRLREEVNGKFVQICIRMLKMLFTYLFVCVGWIFFRADSLKQAWIIIQRVCSGAVTQPLFMHGTDHMLIIFFALICFILIEYCNRAKIHPLAALNWPQPLRWAAYTVLAWSTIAFGMKENAQFIYFQF